MYNYLLSQINFLSIHNWLWCGCWLILNLIDSFETKPSRNTWVHPWFLVVRVTPSLVLCVSLVDRCLSFFYCVVRFTILINPLVFNVQNLYLKTIHSNTNNTSSIELLNRLSNKHKIVTENMHDSTYKAYNHKTLQH